MDQIGKYYVEKKLLSSSCSDLYLCRDQDLDQQVAVKLFAYDDGDPDRMTTYNRAWWQDRFVAEARLIARLDHPHIIQVRELSFLEDGTPYMVMPFMMSNLRVEIGRDSVLPEGTVDDGTDPLFPKRPSLRRSVDVLLAVSDAVAYLHHNGYVHRDIKPGNVLLTKTVGGRPKLCDFGFVRHPEKNNSEDGVWFGTKFYLAPEQGESATLATPASDVFSLGAMAYRMLAGKTAYGNYDKLDVLYPEIPMALVDLVEQSLKSDPKERPQNAKVFADVLRKVDKDIPRQKVALKLSSNLKVRRR